MVETIIKSGRDGISIGKLRSEFPTTTDVEFSERLIGLISEKKVFERNGRLFAKENRSPGRPKKDAHRKPITVRLPADMVDWLRSQKGYTQIVEQALSQQFKLSQTHRLKVGVTHLSDDLLPKDIVRTNNK